MSEEKKSLWERFKQFLKEANQPPKKKKVGPLYDLLKEMNTILKKGASSEYRINVERALWLMLQVDRANMPPLDANFQKAFMSKAWRDTFRDLPDNTHKEAREEEHQREAKEAYKFGTKRKTEDDFIYGTDIIFEYAVYHLLEDSILFWKLFAKYRIDKVEEVDEEVGKCYNPYIETTKTVTTIEQDYNPDYGDDRICECGHPYYRHFDGYEGNAPVGCKYCGCGTFKEATDPEAAKANPRRDY